MGSASYYNGQTATNPQTGERVQFKNGQWVPMSAAGTGGPIPAPDNKEAEKAIETARTAAMSSASAVPDLDRFIALNKKTSTGPIFSGLRLPGWLGGQELNPVAGITKMINPEMGSNLEQMESITSKMTPSQHITPGPMTDADKPMYQAALPSINKYGTSNAAGAAAIKAGQKNAGDYLAFLEDWAKKRGGSVNGAMEKWLEYSAAEPIYSPDGTVRNRKPWRDYFAQPQAGAMPGAPQQAAAPKRIRIDAQGNPIP